MVFECELCEQCPQQQVMAQILQMVGNNLEKLNSSQELKGEIMGARVNTSVRELTLDKGDPPATESIPEARGFDIWTPYIQSQVLTAELRARENIPSLYKPQNLDHFSSQEPPAKMRCLMSTGAQRSRIVCMENILRQGIIQSFRGDEARLVWYMGPNALGR